MFLWLRARLQNGVWPPWYQGQELGCLDLGIKRFEEGEWKTTRCHSTHWYKNLGTKRDVDKQNEFWGCADVLKKQDHYGSDLRGSTHCHVLVRIGRMNA